MPFTPSGTALTAWERLQQTFLRPAGRPAGQPAARPAPEPVDFSRMDDDEKRAHIVRIDRTERTVGIVAAIVGFALALYANVPYMVSKIAVPSTTVKPKGVTCTLGFTYAAKTKTCNIVYPPNHYVLPLIVSLVLAVAIYVTVRIGRRSPLAFTTIMCGLAFGSLYILLPYGVAGGWVMLRAWRTQKYGAPTARTAQSGWVAPPPRGTTRRARSTGPPGSRGRRGAERTTATGRKPPVANKRYTPKTPPKPKKKVATQD